MKVNVEITDKDKESLARIVDRFRSEVTMPPPGIWRKMTTEQVWEQILVQYCVIGNAILIGNLMNNKRQYRELLSSLSLGALLMIDEGREEYIARQLRAFNATRFHNRVARYINNCIENKSVVNNGKVVLFDDLKEGHISDEEMRDILMERLQLRMKSISDFMISIGATREFMAFDTRVMGLLQKHFGLFLEARAVQSSRVLYRILEEALNDACRELGVELSWLDRVLFERSDDISHMFDEMG